MDNNQINIKLTELSKLTPLQYHAKFKEAHDEYMNHRTHLGRLSEKMGSRPYITSMLDRLNHDQLKERDQELLLLLNEEISYEDLTLRTMTVAGDGVR